MTYSADDLATIIQKLEADIASGTSEISFEGHRRVYRTQPEILAAIRYFQQLQANVSGTPRTRVIRMYSRKGL